MTIAGCPIHSLSSECRNKKYIYQLKQDLEIAEDKIKELEEDNRILKKINANLMGDDENVPRYTTKRLKQEIARGVEKELNDKKHLDNK